MGPGAHNRDQRGHTNRWGVEPGAADEEGLVLRALVLGPEVGGWPLWCRLSRALESMNVTWEDLGATCSLSGLCPW